MINFSFKNALSSYFDGMKVVPQKSLMSAPLKVVVHRGSILNGFGDIDNNLAGNGKRLNRTTVFMKEGYN